MGTPKTDVLLVGTLTSVHVRRLASALRDSGLAVRVAGFEGGAIESIPTYSLGSRPASMDQRYGLAIPRLARLIRRYEPSIVHAHYLTSFGLLALLALRLAYPLRSKAALVQTVWGTDILRTAKSSTIHRRLAEITLRRANLVTADSHELRDEILRLAPASRYLRFNFGPPNSLLTAPRQPNEVVVSSRRLDPDTRIDLIIEAFHRAKNRSAALADWRLVVAGDGKDADRIRSVAKDRDDVLFAGQMPADDLHALLLRAEMFVSIPRSDGTSASLLEAMAAGVTPIVNDLPANREWVDRDIGVIVPTSPDAEDIASAIELVQARIPDPDAIRRRVEDATWEQEVAQLIAAYRMINPGPIGGTRQARPHSVTPSTGPTVEA